MKRLLFLFFALLFLLPSAIAALSDENYIQSQIDKVGTKILNLNKIQERIVFVYKTNTKKELLELDKTLTKRQIVVYNGLYQYVQTEDELAAMLAREICLALRTYSGIWSGRISTIETFLGTKKFEIVADKRAVDFMVKAGYNPLALIVFINKTCPQKRSDFISRHNLTSKRLARIYEYITYKYPQYLSNNEYLQNIYYQNFLLNSVENRHKLEIKIRTKDSKEIKYE